ncbi:MAG: DNA/RNA nuclease SfsA [Cyanobacteria bacterium P01_F01_bin.153]
MYEYSDCQLGTLGTRYKRFLADIKLDTGEMITAHCPNTGPMSDICNPGSRVLVSKSDNPKRKLAYTWEAVLLEKPGRSPFWVGANTNTPNKAMRTVLEKRLLPQLGPYRHFKSEVKYGTQNSRIDFLLTGLDSDAIAEIPTPPARGTKIKDEPGIYVEIKNTTWSDGGTLALFPDTVTTRGQKHLTELMAIAQTPSVTNPDTNHRAVMIYFINREDCLSFAPGDERDAKYGELLRQARDVGVEIIPCRFAVSEEGVRFLGTAPCDF